MSEQLYLKAQLILNNVRWLAKRIRKESRYGYPDMKPPIRSCQILAVCEYMAQLETRLEHFESLSLDLADHKVRLEDLEQMCLPEEAE